VAESSASPSARRFRRVRLALLPLAALLAGATLLLPALLFAEEPKGDEDDAIESAIISIEVTTQRGDWFSPWQPQRAAQASGSGFIIGPQRIMTNAHVVSDARQIIVRRNGESTPYFATVQFIGHDSDLAILKVEDKEFDRPIAPLVLGDLPSLRSRVRTYGFPAGGDKLSRTEGVVSRVQFITYLHSGVDNHLGIQTDSAINPGNSGGPVIQDGKVVGVAFQTNTRLSGVGFFIPTPVIKRFMKDIQDGGYDGYGDMGITTSNLMNPMYRDYLAMPLGGEGVVVDRVAVHSSAEGYVQPNDVVLSIDHQPVRVDGTIQYHGHSITFEQVAEEKQLGDPVTMALWRAGARLEVSFPLKPHPTANRLRGEFDRLPAYYIHAGLVFMPLDQEYMNTFGNYWQNAEKHLLYALFYKPLESPETQLQRSVVLTRVLPHPVNSAYRNLSNSLVASVNGVPIRQLADLDAGFAAATGPYDQIMLEPGGIRVVLDRAQEKRAHEEILTQYGIHRDRRLP
jgi:S1-C subfamily serine protease